MLHAAEVECLAAGEAGTPYEFGLKASGAVTAKAGMVAAMRSMPGSPYDEHRRRSQLEQRGESHRREASHGAAERGHRSSTPPHGTPLLIGRTGGPPPSLKRLIEGRRAIEPGFGQMTTDGVPARNLPAGSNGDAIHAVLCGAGHNLGPNLAHLRVHLQVLIVLIPLGRISAASSQ